MSINFGFGEDEKTPENKFEEWLAKVQECHRYFDTREADPDYDPGVLREKMNEAQDLHEKAVYEFGG